MMMTIATSEWTTGLQEQMQQTVGVGKKSFNPAVQAEATPAGNQCSHSASSLLRFLLSRCSQVSTFCYSCTARSAQPFVLGAEVGLMMMVIGLPGKSLVHPRLTLPPVGVQTAGQGSPRPTAPPAEVLETTTLIGTGSSLEALLIDMGKTGPAALLTEVHPRQTRRTDGAGSPLSRHQSASPGVLTVAARLEVPVVTAASDGQGSLPRQQATSQLQQLLQSGAV